jgi:hypothetical protein
MIAERMNGLNIGATNLQSRGPTVDSFTYTRTRIIHGKRSDRDEILPTTELTDGEYHEDEFTDSEYSEDSQGESQGSEDSEDSEDLEASEDSKSLEDTEEESEDQEDSQASPRVHLATPVQERGLRRSPRLATPEPAADQPENRQRATSSLPQSPSRIQSNSRPMPERIRPIRVRAKLRPKSRGGEASQQAHLRFERCQSSPPRGLDFPSP